MNEHVCLDELIYINPALVAEVEGDTNADPNRKHTFTRIVFIGSWQLLFIRLAVGEVTITKP
jgi:hypothetical protein